MRRMLFPSILSEAARDVRTDTTRALLFAVVFGILSATGVLLAVSDQRAALDAAADYRASGASITAFRAEGRVDARSCDAFARLPGVRAAGALRTAPDDLVPSALPGNPLPTKQVSPGFPAVVGASGSSRGGIVLSDQVVDAVGLDAANTLPTRSGAARVTGTFAFPDDGRQGELGFSALIPQLRADTTPYDECWVDVWPENPQVTALLRTTILAGPMGDDEERPTSLQLNGRLGARFTGADDLALGASRWAADVSAVAGLLLGVVSVRLRRLELAAARHAGVGRAAQALGQLVQVAVWSGAGLVLAVPVLIGVVSQSDAASRASLAATGGAALLAGALSAVAGAVGCALLTRESHLFRHFRDR